MQPVFVESNQGGTVIPELKKVVVVHGQTVTISDSLVDALAQSFGRRRPSRGPPPTAVRPSSSCCTTRYALRERRELLRQGDWPVPAQIDLGQQPCSGRSSWPGPRGVGHGDDQPESERVQPVGVAVGLTSGGGSVGHLPKSASRRRDPRHSADAVRPMPRRELAGNGGVHRWTDGQNAHLGDLAAQIARWRRSGRRGFGPGDVFALYLPNVPEYAVAFHGVALAGGRSPR
jgi:hypothetical protein